MTRQQRRALERRQQKGLKTFVVGYIQNFFGGIDKIYNDGSKEYSLIMGGSVIIKRPQVVEYLEDILNGGFTGWGYADTVEKLFNTSPS